VTGNIETAPLIGTNQSYSLTKSNGDHRGPTKPRIWSHRGWLRWPISGGGPNVPRANIPRWPDDASELQTIAVDLPAASREEDGLVVSKELVTPLEINPDGMDNKEIVDGTQARPAETSDQSDNNSCGEEVKHAG
jgi:hypothetical protein